MGGNTLRIGEVAHELGEVILSITDRAEADWDLEFDLFCDCRNLTRPGFALNSLTVLGLRKWSELADVVLAVGAIDETNELLESVVCEPGGTLELDQLCVEFGAFVEERMPVHLKAVCERRDNAGNMLDAEVPISGTFVARVEVRRPYAS